MSYNNIQNLTKEGSRVRTQSVGVVQVERHGLGDEREEEPRERVDPFGVLRRQILAASARSFESQLHRGSHHIGSVDVPALQGWRPPSTPRGGGRRAAPCRPRPHRRIYSRRRSRAPGAARPQKPRPAVGSRCVVVYAPSVSGPPSLGEVMNVKKAGGGVPAEDVEDGEERVLARADAAEAEDLEQGVEHLWVEAPNLGNVDLLHGPHRLLCPRSTDEPLGQPSAAQYTPGLAGARTSSVVAVSSLDL